MTPERLANICGIVENVTRLYQAEDPHRAHTVGVYLDITILARAARELLDEIDRLIEEAR